MAERPPPRLFSVAELAAHDGSVKGRPVLVAYAGRVYDVTRSYPWAGGRHWACARAGRDETGRMAEAPHGPDLLFRVPCVGWLVED